MTYIPRMPAVPFDTFFKALRRGEVPPAIYLHGEEDVLKQEVIREILDRVLDPGLRDFNLDQRSAAELDPEGVETLCHTLPMMADRRVVIVRDVEAWSRRTKAKGEMLRYLEKPAAETVVVLIQGLGDPKPDAELAQRAALVSCDPLPPERAKKWLLLRAAELGLELEPEAAEHLVRVTDAHLGALGAELGKLSGLTAEGPISAARVGDLLGVRHGETQFDWREAVLVGQPGRAAAMLPHLLAQPGVSGVALVALLGTSLIGLGLARAHYDRGARGPALLGVVRS